MQTLTKREKILLYVLLCVVIFVGGIYLLDIPTLNKNADLNTQLDGLKGQLITEKANVIEYGDLDTQIKEITDEYKKVIQNFYTTAMLNEDIDKLITDMAISHNLTPSSLTIGEIADEPVLNYEDYLKQLEKEKDSEGSKSTTNKIEGPTMKVVNISLSVTGNISNLQQLVNDANQSKSLKVATVSYSDQAEDDKDMVVTFKLFLI